MSSPADRAKKATVQIWTPDTRLGEHGTLCGCGFLAGPDLVITCAHVVAAALGRTAEQYAAPEGTILVSFPFLGRTKAWPARVEAAAWVPLVPGGAGDIAILRLEDQPKGAHALALRPEAIAETGGVKTTCWGFPVNDPHSIRSALCDLRPAEPYGVASELGTWQRVIKRGAGNAYIEPGFSGTPLFTDGDYHLAGMICADIPRQDEEAACVAVADLAHVFDRVSGSHRPMRKGALDRTDLLRINRHRQVAQVKRFLHQHRLASRQGKTRPGVVVFLGQNCDRPDDFFQRWQRVHFEEEAVPFGRSMDFLGSAKLPLYEEPSPVWAFVDVLSHLPPAQAASALPFDDVACKTSLVNALTAWQGGLTRNYYLQWDVDCTEWSSAHRDHLKQCLSFVAGDWPTLPAERAALIFLVVTFDDVIDDRLLAAHPFFQTLGTELGCEPDQFCCVDLFTNVTAIDLKDWRKVIGEQRVAPTLWEPVHKALEAAGAATGPELSAEKPARRLFGLLPPKTQAAPVLPFERKPGLTLEETIRIIDDLKHEAGGPAFAD